MAAAKIMAPVSNRYSWSLRAIQGKMTRMSAEAIANDPKMVPTTEALKPHSPKRVIVRSDNDCDTRIVLLLCVSNFSCAK